MSGVPISAGDGIIPAPIRAALERTGWPEEAWLWEQAMVAGLTALAQQDRSRACRRFAEAQALAENALPADDLRRISGTANLATLHDDLTRLASLSARWLAGEAWLTSLRPHARARSSAFHFRLERKHGAAYDQLHHQAMRRLWEAGADRLRPVAEPQAGAAAALARWGGGSTGLGFVDQRKLFAAGALLIG